MYEYNEARDIWLFENDLSDYKQTDEGQRVTALIDYDDYDVLRRKADTDPKDLKAAFENYWNARNDTGLHRDGVLFDIREVDRSL
jgi:hypothetical protein